LLRVLLVDDFEPWRSFLRSIVEALPLITIVGEASDGLAAVQAAKDLKPDLVLLDIGLPQLNGLEVAREVLKVSPNCMIFFVTQESAEELLQEAFRLGAQAYIVKENVGVELLPALEAVLRNDSYVGRSLMESLSDRPATDQLR
jgi:DNA-binding NarL/FixJ family response regulator